jgi:NitT/TauT family transport system permease protein
VALAVEIILIIVVLEFAVTSLHLIDEVFFPAPVAVGESLVVLVTSDAFLRDLSFSVTNYVVGVVLACVVGIVLGLAIGLSSLLDLTLKPFVWAFYAIPKVALAPLIILILGLGPPSKVAMVFLLSVFPVLISTLDGVRTVDPTLIRAGGVYGFRGWRLARSVIVPATIPFILVGVRRAIALGFIGEILGEFLGSTQGLGVRLQRAVFAFDMADAIAVVVLMVLAANIGLIVLDRIQRAVAPWSVDVGKA